MISDQEKIDYELAAQYIKAHPVLSKVIDLLMIEFFAQIDEIKAHVGMQANVHPAAKTSMVKRMNKVRKLAERGEKLDYTTKQLDMSVGEE